MDASFSSYDHVESCERIKGLLNAYDSVFEDKDRIPPADQLTYDNGFYVKCSAIFVDIRGSKKLTEKHKRPVLAKIYRAYISEVIAVMRGSSDIRHVNIEGDCVWGIFDTPYKSDIDGVFSIAAQISSLIDILNWRLEKKDYSKIEVGIGCSWGSALMIKAGNKGSGINDVVYMGDVVNEAAKLCSLGNRNFNLEMHVSDDFRLNLNENNQKLLGRDYTNMCYSGNVINSHMNDWLREQKSK